MRTIGAYLIFAAVALRTAVVLSGTPGFSGVMGLLVCYGFLLLAATGLIRRNSVRLLHSPKLQLAYLSIQAALVIAALILSAYEDVLTLLFIPLSLDAVSLLGRRRGFVGIAVFSLAMVGTLLFSDEGPLFGLAMGILYSGTCFLFGGYADQVRKAETARIENQRTFDELQAAHRRLQGYAEQRVSLAVERERNHLARDLHDSVTQTVFSMNLVAQSARLLWDKEPARAAGQLLRLEELAAGAQREIQSLVSQLSPLRAAQADLPAALQRLGAEQKIRNGLQVSLEVRGERVLSGTIAAGLYSIAHEALTNVAKHGGVCEAVVRLDLDRDDPSLEIEDHGAGFDPQAILKERGHLGLAGMSERAREIGWTLSIVSQPGRGTRICVTGNPAGDPR